MLVSLPLVLALAAGANAHVAAFAKGMFCEGGADPNNYNSNANDPTNPLWDLPFEKWWMQADRGCNKVPPRDGSTLKLPAGGKFTVELAHNQGQTTLSNGGKYTSDWPDGQQHPEDWAGPGNPADCIQTDGAMHTNNQTMASGTAFAISYNSDITKVNMANLAVFTVLQHTPWKRLATYDVPKDLPPCPPGGCYCAWVWIANGCGQPNMFMSNFKCEVTGSTSTKKVAPAQVPRWCKGDKSKCVKGAKQIVAWHQQSGNNIFDSDLPAGAYPGYNDNMGFFAGAQNDIFLPDTATPVPSTTLVTSTRVPSVAPTPSTTLSTSTRLSTSTSSSTKVPSVVPSPLPGSCSG